MITTLSRQLERWQTLLSDLAHPDVEMTVETVAPVVATFQSLHRSGHPFDDALIILIGKLREQLMDGQREGCIEDHEDSDDDNDEITERDDSVEGDDAVDRDETRDDWSSGGFAPTLGRAARSALVACRFAVTHPDRPGPVAARSIDLRCRRQQAEDEQRTLNQKVAHLKADKKLMLVDLGRGESRDGAPASRPCDAGKRSGALTMDRSSASARAPESRGAAAAGEEIESTVCTGLMNSQPRLDANNADRVQSANQR